MVLQSFDAWFCRYLRMVRMILHGLAKLGCFDFDFQSESLIPLWPLKLRNLCVSSSALALDVSLILLRNLCVSSSILALDISFVLRIHVFLRAIEQL